MSVKIQLLENKLLQKDEKKMYNARIKFGEVTSLKSVCETISLRSSLTGADIKGVLDSLAHVIKTEFMNGRAVQLGELGTFSPGLKGELLKEDQKINKQQLRINGINVHPTREFLQDMKLVDFIVIKERKQEKPYVSERKENIVRLIEKNGAVSSTQVAGMNQCSRPTAVRDLNEMIKEQLLKKEMLGGGTYYLKA